MSQIKAVRSKKIAQLEFAKLSGLSRNAIVDYENDLRTPTIEILESIATALEGSIDDLLIQNASTLVLPQNLEQKTL